MKTYTYKFADGTKSTVEVDDELYEVLTEMDRQERYGNRRETRRHVSLESLADKSIEPIVYDDYFSDGIFGVIDCESLKIALDTLTEKQKNIIAKSVIEGMSFRKIACEMGVNKETVREQYMAAIKKIKEIFENTPPK